MCFETVADGRCLPGAAPPNAKDPGTSVTPPITEDALVPKGGAREKPIITDDVALKQEKDDDGTLLGSDGQVVKANKGMILRKSVEYIRSAFFLRFLIEPTI